MIICKLYHMMELYFFLITNKVNCIKYIQCLLFSGSKIIVERAFADKIDRGESSLFLEGR